MCNKSEISFDVIFDENKTKGIDPLLKWKIIKLLKICLMIDIDFYV